MNADEHRSEKQEKAGRMRETLEQLRQMASSPLPSERLQSLRLMRGQISKGRPAADFLELAKPLIEDSDNDVRWQATIVVGESISSNPEAVWEIVLKYGASPDEDMRVAVACVLLEHLLDKDFTTYFSRLSERLKSGSDLFADTLAGCWFSGPQAEERKARVDQLLGRRPIRKV
jgi:hypothetical protein